MALSSHRVVTSMKPREMIARKRVYLRSVSECKDLTMLDTYREFIHSNSGTCTPSKKMKLSPRVRVGAITIARICEPIQDGIPAHRLLSVLNLSHASFKVLNTAALIMRCSVLASCGICGVKSAFNFPVIVLWNKNSPCRDAPYRWPSCK